jgi:hypothetical protein
MRRHLAISVTMSLLAAGCGRPGGDAPTVPAPQPRAGNDPAATPYGTPSGVRARAGPGGGARRADVPVRVGPIGGPKRSDRGLTGSDHTRAMRDLKAQYVRALNSLLIATFKKIRTGEWLDSEDLGPPDGRARSREGR